MTGPRPSRKARHSSHAQPSPDAAGELRERYREYFPRVFAYVYGRIRDSRAAEDLASDVFSKAFAKPNAVAGDRLFEVRLFSIARDLLVSRSLDRSLREPMPEDELLQQPDMARLLDRVRRLELREQDIIALKFDAELSNAQIAQIMGLAEAKVGMVLYRTLRKLRRALERED